MNNKIIKKKIIEKENLNHNKNNNNNNKNFSSNKKNKSCKNLIKNNNNNNKSKNKSKNNSKNKNNTNKKQSNNKNNFPQMNIKKVIKIFNNYNTIVDSNLLINNNNNNKINSNNNNFIINNNNFEEINNIYNNKRIEVKKKLKKNYLHNSSTNITTNLDLNKYFQTKTNEIKYQKKNIPNKNNIIINNNRNISNNFLNNNNNNNFTITVNKINNNNISRNNNKSNKIHNSNSLSLISNKTFLKTTINFKKSKSNKKLKTPLKSNIIHKINFFHSNSNNNIKKYYNNDLIYTQKNKTSNNSFEKNEENNNNIYYNYNSTRNSYKNLLQNNSLKQQINFNENNNKKLKIKEISSISKAGETISYSNSKKINQDNIFITNLNNNNNYNYKFIGVCDGHGENGHIISKFICSNLPKNLENTLNKNFYKNYNNILLKNNIKNACIYTNSQIISNSNINSILSGSTCSSILFDLNTKNYINKLYSINIGDSRSVFFPFHSDAIFLSTDHTPEQIKEKERILSFGGRILKFKEFNNEFVGPLRIWLKNEDVPGLAMTRSFGDLIASSVGVICEPEIKEFDVDEEGVVVIGSDGLWEYFEVSEMEKYVRKMRKNGKSAEFMAGELERIARQKWRENDEGVDDISVVVVYLE